ncbi:HEAT repeat domain-containing protein [Amycolatopsis kentuckyensis]|uniref:HEAT repeat domain-containing protein n=1 Tax=Amycolatopsis kentuckyensis TaxID=218823 RepID=UPI003563316C
MSVAVAPLAKAILSRAGKEIGIVAAKGARKWVLGTSEEKALERALGRAFTEVERIHGGQLAGFDINAGFWEHEGADELSKVLVAGLTPSAAKFAERAVDSLGPSRSDDERLDRILALRPLFKAMLTALEREVRTESALHAFLERADAARTADATTSIAEAMAAGPSSEDDRVGYLGWLIDQHRYVRTAGVVRNTTVQLPLEEVFVGLRARADRHPGDRARLWFEQERQKAAALLEAGDLDQVGYEAVLDRLQTQYGRKFAIDVGGEIDQPVLVLDSVRDASQVLVLGDPGTGKTTLLRYLALRHARAVLKGEPVQGRPARLPIYIRIGDYARQEHPRVGISDFLPDYLNRSECRLPGLVSMLKQQLEAGRCLILLDGLDEVASAELRREVVTSVVNFVAAHSRSGNRFVVTSRVAGYQAAPLPQPFTAMRLNDMDDDTISQFLQVYCRQVEQAETPDKSKAAIIEAGARETAAIEQALRSNAGVRRLAANPLLLTALVLVHRASGRLPHRRVEAYVEVCTALGRTWRSAQGVADADLPDERILNKWLIELGAWMHQNRPEGAATKLELLRVLGPLWAAHQGSTWDPDALLTADPLDTEAGRGVLEFIEKADSHTGLLVERAPGRYGFAHLTFEEYYTGRSLAFRGTATERVPVMRGHLHDPRYEEPILLALGLIGTDYADQIDDVVAQAIYPGTEPSPYEDLLGRDFLFMLRVLADDTPVQTATIDHTITLAINERLDPERSRCRFTSYFQALERHLAALTGTKAADRYITAVDKRADLLTPETVRPWVALADIAAQFGALLPASVTALVQFAADPDIDPSVRVRAGSALADGGQLSKPVIAALVQLTADPDIDTYVQGRAISALARSGQLSKPVITALLELTADPDIDPSVRVQAGSALADRGQLSKPVITALLQLTADPDIDPSVRVQAGSALADRGQLSEPVITALVQLTTDPFVELEARSVLTGGGEPSEPVITALVQLVTDPDIEPSVRVQAGSMLADGGQLSQPVITTLLQLATDPGPDPFMRMRAISALAGSGQLSEPVITALIQLTTAPDIDPYVRVQAGSALADGGQLSQPVITALVQLATDSYVRMRATSALADGGQLSQPVITALVQLTTDPDIDPSVRVHAGSALADGGQLSEPVITALVQLTTDPDIDPSVQERAISALARSGQLSKPVITALLELTADPDIDPSVRAHAGSALAGKGQLSEPVITALVQLTTDPDIDPSVQERAISALADGGQLSEPVITALVQLTTDPDIDPSVRVHAGSALADGGQLSEPVITALVQLVTDPDIDPVIDPGIDPSPDSTVRVRAIGVLAGGGQLNDPVITALVQLATHDADYSIREQAVTALQQALPTRSLREAVAKLFRDEDNDVRLATAATFVEWSRRHPQYFNEIGEDLARACTDPALKLRDKYENRTGWDYAQRGLAAHVEAFNHSMSEDR